MNSFESYPFYKNEDGAYQFVTDKGLEYTALFYVADFLPSVNVYTFEFSHRNALTKSVHDPRVRPTIVAILSEFLNQHLNAVFFVCNPRDGMHRARMLLFDRWFRVENSSGAYIKTDFHQCDIEASVISRNDNPDFLKIERMIVELFGFEE